MLLSFLVLARIVDLFFIASLDRISRDLRLSSDAAGATLMAVGSSAPELFVALFAVLKPGDHQVIGIGSIVGSAIFNLLVIVGAAALARRTVLNWRPMVRDIFFYTATVVLLVAFIWDGHFTLTESIIFLAMYASYVVAVIYWRRILPYEDVEFDAGKEKSEEKISGKRGARQIALDFISLSSFTWLVDKFLELIFPKKERYYLVFAFSILLIAALSYVLVESAVVTAHLMNIPEAIIALTVLAVGTSIPDLFSSIIVAKQGRGDMAVSNAVGSNIFDILVGLGLPFLIVMLLSGGTIDAGGDLITSVIILFGSVILLIGLLLTRRWKIGRFTGAVLVAAYVAYLVYEITKL